MNIYVNDEDIRYAEKGATASKRRRRSEYMCPPSQVVSPLSKTKLPTLSSWIGTRVLRYSRHLIMPEVALEGQKKLKAAKVFASARAGSVRRWLCILQQAGVGRWAS